MPLQGTLRDLFLSMEMVTSRLAMEREIARISPQGLFST